MGKQLTAQFKSCYMRESPKGYPTYEVKMESISLENKINTMDNPQGSLDANIGWLSGIIDGEGHISLLPCGNGRKSYKPEIGITNTDEVLIFAIKKLLDKFDIPYYVQYHKGNENWKTRIEITIRGFKRVYKFLPIILPHLVSKKFKALVLDTYIKFRFAQKERSPITNIDHQFYTLMKNLNGRKRSNPSTTDTQEALEKEAMIQSELRKKFVELAEMSNRLFLGNNILN